MMIDKLTMSPERMRYLRAVVELAPPGYATTIREIRTRTGRQNVAIYEALQRLERDGFVTWERNKGRTIRPTEQGRRAFTEFIYLRVEPCAVCGCAKLDDIKCHVCASTAHTICCDLDEDCVCKAAQS